MLRFRQEFNGFQAVERGHSARDKAENLFRGQECPRSNVNGAAALDLPSGSSLVLAQLSNRIWVCMITS